MERILVEALGGAWVNLSLAATVPRIRGKGTDNGGCFIQVDAEFTGNFHQALRETGTIRGTR